MYTRTLKTKRHNDKNTLSASLFFLGDRIEQRSMVPNESIQAHGIRQLLVAIPNTVSKRRVSISMARTSPFDLRRSGLVYLLHC